MQYRQRHRGSKHSRRSLNYLENQVILLLFWLHLSQDFRFLDSFQLWNIQIMPMYIEHDVLMYFNTLSIITTNQKWQIKLNLRLQNLSITPLSTIDGAELNVFFPHFI